MFNLKYVTTKKVLTPIQAEQAAKHIYDPPSDNSMHNSHHGASNHYDNMSVFMDLTMRIKLMAQTIHTTFKLNRLYGNAYIFGQDEMKKYAKRQYQIIFFLLIARLIYYVTRTIFFC